MIGIWGFSRGGRRGSRVRDRSLSSFQYPFAVRGASDVEIRPWKEFSLSACLTGVLQQCLRVDLFAKCCWTDRHYIILRAWGLRGIDMFRCFGRDRTVGWEIPCFESQSDIEEYPELPRLVSDDYCCI